MAERRNNGGPAFARSATLTSDRDRVGRITEQSGMSLRDWFAGQALAGMLVACKHTDARACPVAAWSYELADAMLEARDE